MKKLGGYEQNLIKIKSELNYDEAMKKALTVRWKVGLCISGEKCWCRVIRPEKEIKCTENEDIYIVGQGCITKEHAEYIVKLHNNHLDRMSK